MRHRVKTNKLSRTGSHRRALARNLAAALHESANIPLDIKLSEEDIEEKEANYDRCI